VLADWLSENQDSMPEEVPDLLPDSAGLISVRQLADECYAANPDWEEKADKVLAAPAGA
jgi:hypothetical protein